MKSSIFLNINNYFNLFQCLFNNDERTHNIIIGNLQHLSLIISIKELIKLIKNIHNLNCLLFQRSLHLKSPISSVFQKSPKIMRNSEVTNNYLSFRNT